MTLEAILFIAYQLYAFTSYYLTFYKAYKLNPRHRHWCQLHTLVLMVAGFSHGFYLLMIHSRKLKSLTAPRELFLDATLLVVLGITNFFAAVATMVASAPFASDEDSFDYIERRYNYPKSELKALLTPLYIKRFPVDDFELTLHRETPGGDRRQLVEAYVNQRIQVYNRVIAIENDLQYQRDAAQYRLISKSFLSDKDREVCDYDKIRPIKYSK